MSITGEQAGTQEPVLRRVLEVSGGDGPPPEAAAAFAQAYLRRPGGKGLREGDPDALAAEVMGALRLADSRGAAAAAVRAFTPDVAADGYATPGSVVETNTPDFPFLVDSVGNELRSRGLTVARVVHPLVGVRRDGTGRVAAIVHPREAPDRESVMHFELDRRLAPAELAEVEDAVRVVLATVRRVVEDFPAMRDRALGLAGAASGDAPDAEEHASFLRWLCDEHFVLLGYREYEVADGALGVVAGSGLGLLAGEQRSGLNPPVPLDRLPAVVRAGIEDGEPLVVGKTNRSSPVHKRQRMDFVGVRRLGPDGTIEHEARLLGIFTTRAYAEPASATPLLRGKLERILAAEDLIAGSHDYKAAVGLFDSFPKDELFAAPVADLRAAIAALLALAPDEVRLLGRRSRDGRSASLIAVIPRARHGGELLDRLLALVAGAHGGAHTDVQEVLGEGDSVRLHFTVHDPDGLPDVDTRELERRVREAARTWDDAVGAELAREHGPERGAMLAARWLARFPEAYRAVATDPVLAAGDVACFERAATGAEPFVVGLQQAGDRTRVSLYTRGPKLELSRATPMLEHLGMRVIEEVATRLDAPDELWVQAFTVLGPGDVPLDPGVADARIADAIAAVQRGATESDSLNRLVVSAGLDWRQVDVLRAYRRYRQRLGSRYTEAFQNDVIAANPVLTAKLIELFERRFDPSREADPQAAEALRDEIAADLDAIALLDHDRILRNQLGAIEATVRTNVYRPDRDAMAFKLRSADVPAIPQPAPLFEIYVYAPDMEGIHLRGGRVARGGLRYSDRMDYRTEVFGLLRAQMTKNAVIVPAGAKGGFIVKEPVAGIEDVRRHYVRYIEALLDVTDNLVDGAVDRPAGVRVHDEDDTYLVVAADKGTATFSDTANAIAVRRGFWLGDAFASGGSNGYDHKALGITARGAWESVKRHFRELGLDPERDPVSAVGIGDMSGDVFGNGMLLSSSLRLIAAYDHRHVFIDPDPADSAASHAERRRLFELPRSSWEDYDRALISPGGGVWSRGLKRIELPPQARAALGIDDEVLTPAEVIRAILRAPVDLLFNGGIGTVVKSVTESDADAHDRASDAIRVDARDLRCRVVGEGGNLGFTQRARIEFAEAGGLVNADFIDNSAGVDCSDHEVNLKILLDLAVSRGELDGAGRDALLREVTDDVTRHVLYDSFLQAQILAQEAAVSSARLLDAEDLMDSLEDAGLLDRSVEALPSAEELSERSRGGRGLERPELAVLLAYAKRALTDAVLDSSLADDPELDADLRHYFPDAVVERFGHLLKEHPLRRELVATLAANDVVDALGPMFVSGLVAELGAEPAAVVRAFRTARAVTGADERWDAIESLGATLDHDLYLALMRGADDLVRDVARWYLVHSPAAGADAVAARDRELFAVLEAELPGLRSDAWRADRDVARDDLVASGVPPEIAARHAQQRALVHAPDVLLVARDTGRDVIAVAEAFFGVGEGLGLEWLEGQVDALPATGRLSRWAIGALLDDLLAVRRELARRALEFAPGEDPHAAVEQFLEARAEPLGRLRGFTRALAIEGTADLAGLSLAIRHLRALAG